MFNVSILIIITTRQREGIATRGETALLYKFKRNITTVWKCYKSQFSLGIQQLHNLPMKKILLPPGHNDKNLKEWQRSGKNYLEPNKA